MANKDYKISQDLLIKNPSKDILSGVFKQIERINRQVFYWRLGVSAGIVGLSSWGIYSLVGYLNSALVTSGATDFLRLAFTDSSVITQNFNDFFWAVIESMPITELVVIMAVGLVLVGSLISLIKNIRQFSRVGGHSLNV